MTWRLKSSVIPSEVEESLIVIIQARPVRDVSTSLDMTGRQFFNEAKPILER